MRASMASVGTNKAMAAVVGHPLRSKQWSPSWPARLPRNDDASAGALEATATIGELDLGANAHIRDGPEVSHQGARLWTERLHRVPPYAYAVIIFLVLFAINAASMTVVIRKRMEDLRNEQVALLAVDATRLVRAAHVEMATGLRIASAIAAAMEGMLPAISGRVLREPLVHIAGTSSSLSASFGVGLLVLDSERAEFETVLTQALQYNRSFVITHITPAGERVPAPPQAQYMPVCFIGGALELGTVQAQFMVDGFNRTDRIVTLQEAFTGRRPIGEIFRFSFGVALGFTIPLFSNMTFIEGVRRFANVSVSERNKTAETLFSSAYDASRLAFAINSSDGEMQPTELSNPFGYLYATMNAETLMYRSFAGFSSSVVDGVYVEEASNLVPRALLPPANTPARNDLVELPANMGSGTGDLLTSARITGATPFGPLLHVDSSPGVAPAYVRSCMSNSNCLTQSFATRLGSRIWMFTVVSSPTLLDAVSHRFRRVVAFGVLTGGLICILGTALAYFTLVSCHRTTSAHIKREGDARFAYEAYSRAAGMVAHELRNPLHIISASAEMLAPVTARDPVLHAAVRDLIAAAEQSHRVLADIMNLSALQQGRLEIRDELLLVAPFIQRVLAPLDTQLRNDVCIHWHIESGTPAAVITDPLRVQQVVLNGVTNAIANCSPAGRIHVIVRACEITPSSPCSSPLARYTTDNQSETGTPAAALTRPPASTSTAGSALAGRLAAMPPIKSSSERTVASELPGARTSTPSSGARGVTVETRPQPPVLAMHECQPRPPPISVAREPPRPGSHLDETEIIALLQGTALSGISIEVRYEAGTTPAPVAEADSGDASDAAVGPRTARATAAGAAAGGLDAAVSALQVIQPANADDVASRPAGVGRSVAMLIGRRLGGDVSFQRLDDNNSGGTWVYTVHLPVLSPITGSALAAARRRGTQRELPRHDSAASPWRSRKQPNEAADRHSERYRPARDSADASVHEPGVSIGPVPAVHRVASVSPLSDKFTLLAALKAASAMPWDRIPVDIDGVVMSTLTPPAQ